ncbi:MAG: glycosyltransferase family 2 protein [Mycobacteriales bacterium]
MTALSVVVPCRDRAALLRGCLVSLRSAVREEDEVIVVDAGSLTEEVRGVAEEAGVHYLRAESHSASAARNAGWRAARHDRIGFVDDDCRPLPGWGAAMAEALDELDAVCGQVRPDGDGHLSVLLDAEPSDYAADTPVAALGHGANLAVRRAALVAVGGWEELLGPGTDWPGAEDKELLVRLLRHGARAGYRPEAVVEHLQWRSRRQALRAELGYARGAGALVARGLPAGGVRDELRTAVRDLRAGYQYGAVAGLVRAGGVAWGRASWRRR